MQLASSLLFLLLSCATSSPLSRENAAGAVEKRADRGSYTVAGLGSRKQAILNAGGNTLDLAIAMLETETMQTNYPYGNFTPCQDLISLQFTLGKDLELS